MPTTGRLYIAYSVFLPEGATKEDSLLLSRLQEAFLAFLEKESCKEKSKVFFGGLISERSEGELLLLAAFCPFEERRFFPFARIFLDEEGRIASLVRLREKEHPTPDRPNRPLPKDSPRAKGSAPAPPKRARPRKRAPQQGASTRH